MGLAFIVLLLASRVIRVRDVFGALDTD
jgi:hypothetical protein